MKPEKKNIFKEVNIPLKGEIFEEISTCKNVIIERIISSNKPDKTIYNQEENEWVILLEGEATLAINNNIINLTKGDYLFIPKHTLHQVISTSQGAIWLAIHIY